VKVVDASVVLIWLLREPVPAAAQRILDEHITGVHPLVAPELLQYEVANVLARGAGLPPRAALVGHERFQALEIGTLALGDAEYRRALDLALRHTLTVHDASYLALAQALGVSLATADRKLARRVSRMGVVEVV
jgi:predicted nucleic acid-binding protein